MKIFKKTGTGLALLLLALFAMLFLSGKQVLAAVAPGDINGGTYVYQDRGNITGDYGASGTITFTDQDPLDGNRNYQPNQGGFCKPSSGSYGITIPKSADLTAASIKGQLNVGYLIGNNCNQVQQSISIKNPQTPVPVAAATFEWDGDTINSFPGDNRNVTFTSTTTKDSSALYLSNQPAGNCPQNGAILLKQAGGNHGTYFVLSGITTGRGSLPLVNLSKYPLLNATGAINDSKCHVESYSNITISGSVGQAAVGGPNTVAGTGSAGDSCEASTNFSLSWVMCPLFEAATSITQKTISFFESELSFTVAQDLGSASCKINSQGCQASVRVTWSIIKNIASIILVIIMLVMIFSQALSFGPFDAYTVRKMMPKLVAAVILMQLSWPILAWVIYIFNDIGKGLEALLYAPFGGPDTLNNLGALLQNAGISKTDAVALNYVGIAAVGVSTVAALPLALFLAFSAVVALFTAWVTLIFRKILIIMLLIFAPLAIIAWILPGTQRYWKLWSDNLIKVLSMFPLVVAIVAVGRIFAYVAGPQSNAFLGLILVLVGFIGPLFILPRTFKWGGSIMSAAGGAITNVGSSLNKRAEEPIKGWTKRQVQGRFAKQYKPKGAAGSTWLNRTATSLAGGRIIPTKYRSAILTQSGDKWNEERDAEALALLKRKGETAMKDGHETAVLNDDKTGFAKYDRDSSGNILDKGGNVVYRKVGVDKDGKDIFHNLDGSLATDFDKAHKVDVSSYEEADKRMLTGVAAMKQMWVDLADESESSHERKMAIRQLTATSSWPEIQGSLSKKGNKVIDTEAWNSSITTSTEDYPRVLRSRVDATPHIDNAAKAELEAENARRRSRGEAELTGVDAKNFISKERVLYSIEKQMSNEDFSTQSDGYWEEVARVSNMRYEDGPRKGQLTDDAVKVQQALRKRFEAIHDIGGTAPQQLLGHLVGGSVQKHVDRALGSGVNVKDYVTRQTIGGSTSKSAVAASWETTIPDPRDLSDPTTRAQYKTSLLTTTPGPGGAVVVGPTAKVLAEGLAYNAGGDKTEQINLLNELKFTAAASPEATTAYNEVVKTIHGAYDRRVQEIVNRAIASRATPAEVDRIRIAAEAAAATEKANYRPI